MQKQNKFENIYQDAVCKVEAILLQQQCVSTLRPRNMAAILQTIVWNSILFTLRLNLEIDLVTYSAKWRPLRIVHNMLTQSGRGNVTVILQTMFSN